jgi:hypothetical protein
MSSLLGVAGNEEARHPPMGRPEPDKFEGPPGQRAAFAGPKAAARVRCPKNRHGGAPEAPPLMVKPDIPRRIYRHSILGESRGSEAMPKEPRCRELAAPNAGVRQGRNLVNQKVADQNPGPYFVTQRRMKAATR